MTNHSLSLSRSNVSSFLTCPRRFQLRTLERLAWPDLALDLKQRQAVEQGQHFHLTLERYFSGLPIDESAILDRQLLDWWRRFEQRGPTLPEGRRLPEIRLSVPIGSHFLIGRFDLVIIETRDSSPYAHIFDWKTSRPRSESDLQSDWQTRLYLAMMAQSGSALIEDGSLLQAGNITLTYWYTDEPNSPRRINYSQNQHDKNWSDICTIVDEIDSCLQEDQWPLTDNWSHCRKCAYQAYCGRWEAGRHEKVLAEEQAPYHYELDFILEPETP